MRLKTRIFELDPSRSLPTLATILGLSVSQVYRVKQGTRRINEKFIIGALTAFPEYKFEDLFYTEQEDELYASRRMERSVKEE